MTRSKYRGCMLGGAVGDALGAPVEFMSLPEILQTYGSGGIQDFDTAYGVYAAITDDTQMTLFTAEGLLRAQMRHNARGICHGPSVVSHAYLRWLITQSVEPKHSGVVRDGILISEAALHHRRAPGNTCIEALSNMQRFGAPANNNSKGCGGVMRMAPVGLWAAHQGKEAAPSAFDLGIELAALTHGHPTGQLTAGFLAALICLLLHEMPLSEAVIECLGILKNHEAHEETYRAVSTAVDGAAILEVEPALVEGLGQGWVAEEALAISLFCCLGVADPRQALLASVNHGGDSDSTGSIAGNILGAVHGVDALPSHWVEQVELSQLVMQISDDLYDFPKWDAQGSDNPCVRETRWADYPGD